APLRRLFLLFAPELSRGCLDKFSDRRSRHRSGLTRHFQSVLKKDHRWNSRNAKARGEARQFLRVHFSDNNLARSFRGHFDELRRNHLAWPTPRRPKIDEHGQRRSRSQRVKGEIAFHIDRFGGRSKLCFAFLTAKRVFQNVVLHAIALSAVWTGYQ